MKNLYNQSIKICNI